MKKLFTLFAFVLTAGILTAQVDITFAVDMNDVADFDPAGGAFIAGEFQSWSPDQGALTDDDGNGVWSRTYSLMPRTYAYKFGQGNTWGNNEGGGLADCGVDDGNGGFNRTIEVTEAGTVVFKYDSCEESELTVSTTEVSTIANVQVAPNPMTDQAVIRFDNLTNGTHDVYMTNVAGQIVRQYVNVAGDQLVIDRNELNSGLYFVTFMNEAGEAGSLKLSIQ